MILQKVRATICGSQSNTDKILETGEVILGPSMPVIVIVSRNQTFKYEQRLRGLFTLCFSYSYCVAQSTSLNPFTPSYIIQKHNSYILMKALSV